MKTIVMTLAAAAVAMSTLAAEAGGFKSGGSTGVSSGLINVSPSIGAGSINLLNGTSVLNGSPILSGNNVSGILNGTTASVGGILGGVTQALGGNKHKLKK